MTRRQPSGGGIGTLNETSLHDALKRRIDADPAHHEVHIHGVVADVCDGFSVTEIQTKGCYRLTEKIGRLLQYLPVTVVVPAASSKRVWWIDPETGEASGGRMSGRHATFCELWREIPGLLRFLDEPGFSVRIMLLEWDEYKYLDGYGPDRKVRATRADRVLRGVTGECTVSSRRDLWQLIPEGLAGEFRSTDFAKAGHIRDDAARTALKILTEGGFTERIGRDRHGYRYKMAKNDEEQT